MSQYLIFQLQSFDVLVFLFFKQFLLIFIVFLSSIIIEAPACESIVEGYYQIYWFVPNQ